MTLARHPVGGSSGDPGHLGPNPSPSTDGRKCQTTSGERESSHESDSDCKTRQSTRPESSVSIVDCPHLWMLNGQLVIRGMVVTGREATELPWRRKKDNEPASQAEIGREIETVKALAIRGKVQVPKDFETTKLYLREDIK